MVEPGFEPVLKGGGQGCSRQPPTKGLPSPHNYSARSEKPQARGRASQHYPSTWLLCFHMNPFLSAQVPPGSVSTLLYYLWLCEATSKPSCRHMRSIQHYGVMISWHSPLPHVFRTVRCFCSSRIADSDPHFLL